MMGIKYRKGDVRMHSKFMENEFIKQIPILIGLGMFSLLTSISGSSTNLALPKISEDLKITNGQSTWIIQIGLIVSAITFVLFGRLGDSISKTFIFTNGGIIFLVGSLITGMALDFPIIMLGRAIQSLGVAMIMANSLGIVSQYFSNETRGEALAIISMFISIGAISGPALGGIILSFTSWRWIYLFNIPLGIIIIFFSRKQLAVPKVPLKTLSNEIKSINWFGELTFAVGLTFLIIGTVIAFAAFFQDRKFHDSLISNELVKNADYLLSISILLVVMLVNSMSNILLPFYLQSYGGISPFVSGLLLMVQSLTMLIISPISGYISDHWNRYDLTIIGLLVLLISQVGYVMYPRNINLLIVSIPIIVNGIGLGLFLSPNNAIIMGVVDESLSGVAGSLTSFARTLGVTIGISFSSILLFVQLPHVQRITPALGQKFMNAFVSVFVVATVISAVVLVAVIFRRIQNKNTI